MRVVDVPEYDFVTHQRSTRTTRVEPADVVIIEGILVLHEPAVRSMLNMKIFVDTDDDVRLARRCVRRVSAACVRPRWLSSPQPGICGRSWLSLQAE